MYQLPQPNKYKALKSKLIDGHSFHSLKEAGDYLWLKQLQKEGLISDLKIQVRYRVFINEYHIGDSIIDFQFQRNGKTVWYETKGLATDLYLWKKRCIKATLPENHIFLENGTEKQIRLIA